MAATQTDEKHVLVSSRSRFCFLPNKKKRQFSLLSFCCCWTPTGQHFSFSLVILLRQYLVSQNSASTKADCSFRIVSVGKGLNVIFPRILVQMWSSFLNQIQQRIDDAADLLGDEEGEELEVKEENVDERPHTQGQGGPVGSSSSPQDFVDTPQYTSTAAVSSNAQGWEDEGLDDLVPPTPEETHPPLPSAKPSAATEVNAPDFSVASSNTVEIAASGSDVAVDKENCPRTGEDKEVTDKGDAKAEPENAASSSARSEMQADVVVETPAELDATDVPRVAAPPVQPVSEEQSQPPPSVIAEEQGARSFPPLLVSTDAATDHNTDAGPVLSLGASGELKEIQKRSGVAHAHDTHNTSGSVATDATDPQPEPPADTTREADTGLSSASPLSNAAKESGDVAQLLRFQQQLAEEMENVAGLQKENSLLKAQVRALKAELSTANARLVKTAGSEEQISMLIEKLGKEKERHKTAANERSELEEHVQDLEEELEEFRLKEQAWISGNEQQRQNESAAQQRIAQLEKELRARDSLMEETSAKLRETTHQNSVLQRQVEELKSSYSTQLDTVRETNSDTVDQLRREVEQLRSSLQTLSTEYDTRTTELEREVQQSNMRAHQAEARFSEVELGSVNTLQDLRRELEDSQRSIAAWKAEAQKTRSEYTELLDQYAALKRSRAAAEAELRERLAAESGTVTELRKGHFEWEARYQALQETLRAAQSESEEQRKAIMQLEAANQKLKITTADSFNRSQSEVSIGSPVPTKGSLEASLSGSPFTSRPGGRAAVAGVPMNPFANRERPVWSDTTDRKTRERLEQEVVRQSMELERMRQVANENAEWKNRYLQLQSQHDLLLQLHGQLEEQVSGLRAKATTLPPAPAAEASKALSTPAQ
jgi:hypothetical protein